mgnify:CR=1 FL=1
MARANMPLTGITVLDFGQVYQGPYATLLMATAGADVIKIEPPNGEPLRRPGCGPSQVRNRKTLPSTSSVARVRFALENGPK